MSSPRLLMVYNADGGLLAGAMDLLHKTFSPSTYACALCAVTYDTFGMRPRWRRFVESLPLPVVFHHRDDFAAAYPGAQVALPAILLERDGALETLIGPAAFAALPDLPALEAAVTRALSA